MSTADPRGKFVWHELLSGDTSSAEAFYPKVVSWKSQPWEHDASYTLMMGKHGPVGGVMGMSASVTASPHWIPYVGVDDPHATVAQAKSMGATVTKDVSSLPNGGSFAMLTDPQGAEFAIYKSSTPDNGGASADVGEFGWHELSTSDADAALRFYTTLFGWELGPKHDMGETGLYHLFLRDGNQYGGVFNCPPGDSPSWLCYVRVDDVGKAAGAVKAAGGRVLNGPMEVPGGSWIAQVLDPEGVAFALLEARARAVAEPPPAAKPATPKPKAPKLAAPAAASASASTAPKSAVKPAAKPAVKAKAKKKPAKKVAKKAKKKAKKVAKKVARKAVRKVAKKARPAAKKAKKRSAKKAAGKKKAAAKKAAKRGKARKHR
jgi:predicted enzyme related to lactoylglutathione lyase